jgi:ATPase family protein associated with various cellular activities (AAA)
MSGGSRTFTPVWTGAIVIYDFCGQLQDPNAVRPTRPGCGVVLFNLQFRAPFRGEALDAKMASLGRGQDQELRQRAIDPRRRCDAIRNPSSALRSDPFDCWRFFGPSFANSGSPDRIALDTRRLAEATKLKSASGKARGAVLLLVDEADALAQSREATQMHHEDKAGVNAFIRGVDRIANAKLPAAVLMCTNRINALDPAVRRRAADVLTFDRPGDEQRRIVLSTLLEPMGLLRQHVDALVRATGPQGTREYGYTFSDIVQRLLPTIVLDAYPSRPINGARAVEIARTLVPTPPFREDGAGPRP